MLKKAKNILVKGVLPRQMMLVRHAPRHRRIFLTFDDGPCHGTTHRVLEVLARHDVKATFFVIGHHARQRPELIREIDAAGHRLGNHSYHHERFWSLPLTEQIEEMQQTNRLLESITGNVCTLFRAPQGRWNLGLVWHLYRGGITAAHWSRDSLDYRREPAAHIVKRFQEQPPVAGDILLFHDDNDLSAEALEELLPLWRAQGFEFGVL